MSGLSALASPPPPGECRWCSGALPKRMYIGLSRSAADLMACARLEIVCGDDDVEVVHRPQRRQVVQRVVRRAERTVAHAGADADQLDRPIRVGDVILDELERAGGQKARRRNREDVLSRRRQPRRDADEILLRDPQLDDLLRQRGRERPEFPDPRESLVTASTFLSALASDSSVSANSSRFGRPIFRPRSAATSAAAGVNMDGAGALMTTIVPLPRRASARSPHPALSSPPRTRCRSARRGATWRRPP